MYEDNHLESDYEDRYTIDGDILSEDVSYFEEDIEDNDDETDRRIAQHEMDIHDEMRYPEWTERSYGE